MLNPSQLDAVTNPATHILVKAAPGSGKTRVLTERAARLLESDVHPSELLMLTFTRKSAGEMKERLEHRLPGRKPAFWRALTVTTFHGWACSILRLYADRFGMPRNFSIRDEDDKTSLVLYAAREIGKCPPAGVAKRKGQWTSAARLWEEADVRARYFGLLREAKALDFDGLERELLKLLGHADIAEELRRRYPVVLVDEGQDTSEGQQQILDALNPASLFVVGDHAQSIYSFRGANVDGFVALGQRPGWVTIELATNYRSLPPIVDAASRLGAAMATPGLAQVAGRSGGDARTIAVQSGEADRIVDDLWAVAPHTCGPDGGPGWSSMAILSPTWALLEQLAETLADEGIPHVLAKKTLAVWDTGPAKWLVNCLRAAVNPDDHVALYEALTAFTPRVYPGTWAKLRADAMRAEASILAHYQAQAEAPVLVDDISRLSRALAVPGVFVEKLSEIGLRTGWPIEADILLTQLRTELERLHLDGKVAELRQVETAVCAWGDARQATGERMSVQDLLDWYAGRHVAEASVTEAEQGNAIVLSTIHGAKGLEWPQVWILGCEEGRLPRSAAGDTLEEQRRLFYVAVTRGMLRVRLCHTAESTPSRFIAEALGAAEAPRMEPGTPTWDAAWAALAAHPINIGLTQPTVANYDGEAWQYMGSNADGHCFRHRCHPTSESRVYLVVRTTDAGMVAGDPPPPHPDNCACDNCVIPF